MIIIRVMEHNERFAELFRLISRRAPAIPAWVKRERSRQRLFLGPDSRIPKMRVFLHPERRIRYRYKAK